MQNTEQAEKPAVDIDSIALDAATKILAINANRLPGSVCQHKAMIQCIVRDALESYKPSTYDQGYADAGARHEKRLATLRECIHVSEDPNTDPQRRLTARRTMHGLLERADTECDIKWTDAEIEQMKHDIAAAPFEFNRIVLPPISNGELEAAFKQATVTGQAFIKTNWPEPDKMNFTLDRRDPFNPRVGDEPQQRHSTDKGRKS
jgi:hypothetical protein